ncbi:MAG TPA: hypothetical protein VFN67_06230 [Polyangiales bacterium]|jgi:hypothetical protein|nr:hypothetical protein [Polyangiales bacterium]
MSSYRSITGQSDVEDRQLRLEAAGRIDRRRSIERDAGQTAAPLQQRLEQLGWTGVVIDDQH